MSDRVSKIIPLCFKVTEEQKEAIRKANEETYKFYNIKPEKSNMKEKNYNTI